MWKLIENCLVNFFAKLTEDRLKREEIHREQYNKLRNDRTLNQAQFDALYRIIHCGGTLSLHGTKQYKNYTEEAIKYNQIIRHRKSDNVDELYNQFKQTYLI